MRNRSTAWAAWLLLVAAPAAWAAESWDPDRFTIEHAPEVQAVPVTGWRALFPAEPADPAAKSGIRLEPGAVMLEGVETPALKLVLTTGAWTGSHPVVELPLAFNADRFNGLAFQAKVEVPAGMKGLGATEAPSTGWFSYQFNAFADNFGVAVHDGGFDWAARGVPTTHFLNHVDRTRPDRDGFRDFRWDMRYEDRSGNKGFIRDRAKALRFYYDTRKIPEGRTVVVTIAAPRLVSGIHARFDEPARYALWTNAMAGYRPDYSDSSRFLGPPPTGRLSRPIPLARNGKALAEIVVDFSSASDLTNTVPAANLTLEARVALGREGDVLRLAGAELQRWLGKVTGARFPFLTEPSTNRGVKIFLGAGFARPHFPADLAALASDERLDGYAVREKGGSLYIFGALPKGTLNGIYAFIENNTDLIWAFPDEEAGAIFTPRPDLDAVWADALDKPSFVLRGWLTPSPWLRYNRGNFTHLGRYDADRRGDYSELGGHCLSIHGGRFGREAYARFHPLIDGARPAVWSEYRHQMCLTHPELFPIYMERLKADMLEGRWSHLRVTRIGVDDNWGYCQCETCSAPITLADGRVITPADFNAFYSAWFYRFLNRVADERAALKPGFITSTYAYFMAAPVPPIGVSPNIRPWLCPYVRKSIREPVFAPVNQHWWRLLREWKAASPGVVWRDYYGLYLSIYPLAETLAADLRAMRDIGALRITTEGFASDFGDDLGAAEEKWVVTRLYWNPDADVEALRKYYLQRTFREAAPAMERFRGAIRQAWYQRFPFDLDFEENRETAGMIRLLGLEPELRGHLRDALAAARHPASRARVERTIAAFDLYLSGAPAPKDAPPKPAADPEWEARKARLAAMASGKDPAACSYFEKDLADPGLTLEQLAAVRLHYAQCLLAASNTAGAATLIDLNLEDPRLESASRTAALKQLYARVVEQDPSILPARAFAAIERFRAIAQPVGGETEALAAAVARGFRQRGDASGGARVLELNRDRPGLFPLSRAERQKALRDYWSETAKKVPGTPAKQEAEKEHDRLVDLYRVAQTNELTADRRAEAAFGLLEAAWETLPVPRRAEQVDRLVGNPWIDNALRAKAARKIPLIYPRPEGVADWAAMAEHVLRAIGAGDWSGIEQGRDDKHALVCEAAGRLLEAGERERAQRLLKQAIPALGYDAGRGDPKRRERIQALLLKAG